MLLGQSVLALGREGVCKPTARTLLPVLSPRGLGASRALKYGTCLCAFINLYCNSLSFE